MKNQYADGGSMFEAPIGIQREVKGKTINLPVTDKVYSSEINRFVDYVHDFYEENGFTKAEVKKAVDKYLAQLEFEQTWGGGDSVDRERVYEYLELEGIEKNYKNGLITRHEYEGMKKEYETKFGKKYADGGFLDSSQMNKLDNGFTIPQLSKMLDDMFPDSFKFEVFKREQNKTMLDYEYEDKVKDDKLILYFHEKSYDRDLNYEVRQGQENTYFTFLLSDDKSNAYIGTFGFKDKGYVDESYITKFTAFLYDAYHHSFEIKHSVMANGGSFAKGGFFASNDLWYKPSNSYLTIDNKSGVVKEVKQFDGTPKKEINVNGDVYRKNTVYGTFNSIKDNSVLTKQLIEKDFQFAKGGEIADIEKYKKALIAKAKTKGLYENFGQDEVRKLSDKYGYSPSVSNFDNWTMNFDLSSLKKYADGGEVKVPARVKERLEELREEIREERISTGEILELESLKEYIDPSDVELLQWAGVEEYPEDEDDDKYADGGELKDFEQKVKEALKVEGKWHFISENFDNKSVQLKMYVGKKEVDVQIFKINGIHARMPKNYTGKRETLKMIMDNFDNKFELGGAFMTTDLAGHTGGGTGGLNAGMPLDGFSGTNYTGLVGETGAMSSGEMFENGGGVEERLVGSFYYDSRKDKTFRVIYSDKNEISIKYFDKSKNPIGRPIDVPRSEFDYLVSMGAWGKYKQPYFENGGGVEKFKWQDAEIGDSARVKELNRTGVIVKTYGRKFHLKFGNGTEKTFDASELEFIDDRDNYAEGGVLYSAYTDNPLKYLSLMGANVNSDLNYSTSKNGINYYVGFKKDKRGDNKAIVVAFIEDENNYMIDKEDAREMAETAREKGVDSVELYTNYGVELHTTSKTKSIGFDKIHKVVGKFENGGGVAQQEEYGSLIIKTSSNSELVDLKRLLKELKVRYDLDNHTIRINTSKDSMSETKYKKVLNSLKEMNFGNDIFEAGGVMMQNQQVINDASQSYANYYLNNGGGVFKDGGAIKNQYEGRTADDVWKNWTEAQKSHFLLDHSELLDKDRMENNLGYTRTVQKDKTFAELTPLTKRVLEAHVESGQYANGGAINGAINKKVYALASKKKLLMSDWATSEYNKIMTQALVESLTDANFYDEAKQVVAKAEKQEWSDDLYKSEYYNPNSEVGNFAREVASICEYDRNSIIDAYSFLTKMQGSKVSKLIDDLFSENADYNSYAKGGSMNSSGEITINKRNFDVIVMPKKLEIEVQITRADTVDQYGLNDAEVEWHQERWGYVIKADDNKKFNKALRVLGITQKYADGGFMNNVYAKGGMFDDNDGFMKMDNNRNFRYPEREVHVDTIDEPIDLTTNVDLRRKRVNIEPLNDDIDLNDDNTVRARLSYEDKNRTPEKIMRVNPRMIIENFPMPKSSTHKND